VTKSAPAHLRLFSETTAVSQPPSISTDQVAALRNSFARATGWSLEYERLARRTADRRDELDFESFELRLATEVGSHASEKPPIAYDDAAALADGITGILNELMRSRDALRKREAELAAGVPLVSTAAGDRHLAEKLAGVLRGVTEAIGGCAAGVYLLDSGTTELKLRTQWGLPEDRFVEPARPLAGAMADLEALAGHAVALEDAAAMSSWNLPEPFPAAVCVPISSATTPLGTLWVFADKARPFSDHEVNLVEISAGRIASDLEREMLLVETGEATDLRRHWNAAVQHRANRTPQVAPLVEGWEIAVVAGPHDETDRDFYDWFADGEGRLMACLGRSDAEGFAAALQCETVRAAWRAHARHGLGIDRVLTLVNEDLWAGATEASELDFLGCLAGAGGQLAVAGAGRAFVLRTPRDGEPQLLNIGGPALGIDVEVPFSAEEFRITPDEIVVVAGDDRPLDSIVEAWRNDLRAGDLRVGTGDPRTAREAAVALDRVLKAASIVRSPLLVFRRTE
jgi:phosphoserine phosphatase RsbU/P